MKSQADSNRALLDKIAGARNEDEVRTPLAEWCRSWSSNDHVRTAYTVPGGEIDVLVESYKIVIETKAPGLAGPGTPRKSMRGQETPLEQLARYIKHMRDAEGPFHDRLAWRGVITDGRDFYLYQWDSAAGKLKPHGGKVQVRNDDAGVRQLNKILREFFADKERKGKKPPPPLSLADVIIQPLREGFDLIMDSRQSGRFFHTKFELWKSVLSGSGVLPPRPDLQTRHMDRLFLDHCLLVATARAIRHTIISPRGKPANMMKQGFVSWMVESYQGSVLLERLFEEVGKYDWQRSTRDVLRGAYESLIPQKDRHDFGEYYTPDWLAEFICNRVLDEEWLERAVAAAHKTLSDPEARRMEGVGVLDPACGSGTFLFHAARRIAQYAGAKGLADEECSAIAVRLVHGTDVHPVAVEMAQATLLTALPTKPQDSQLMVRQGDSLLLRYWRQNQLDGEKALNIITPGRNQFKIPSQLLDSDYFESVISDVVSYAAADAGKKRAPDFSRKRWAGVLPAPLVKEIKEMAVKLRTVFRAEGNSVWEWYLRNLTHPLLLHRHKVDRIVANPPWVSSAVTASPADRESAHMVMEMKQEYGLRKGGLGAGASEFNLAAVFTVHTRNLYLADKSVCGFVLPDSALKSSGWKQFADPQQHRWSETHSLKDVKNPPFSGAAASVWIHDFRKRKRKHYEWRMKKGAEKVGGTEGWESAAKKVRIVSPAPLPSGASHYDKCFRKGSNMNPTRFVVVRVVKSHPDGTVAVEGRIGRRDKAPWTEYPHTAKTVEAAALLPCITPDSLQPFRMAGGQLYLLGPFEKNPTNGLLREENAVSIFHNAREWRFVGRRFARAWAELDNFYRKERKRSLAELLDYSGNLSAQSVPDDRAPRTKIAYNKSGQHVCAARTGYLCNDMLYWAELANEKEALYLIAVLNSLPLQEAFRQARQNDRDFHKHIWKKIPIPVFDRSNVRHKELASLAAKIEKRAAQWPPEESRADIRSRLAASPEMEKISAAIRAMKELAPYCDWGMPGRRRKK